MTDKKKFMKKILFVTFSATIFLSILLMAVRIFNSISLTQPYQVITTGADHEILTAIWQSVNGLFSYSNHLKQPYNFLVDNHHHAMFIFVQPDLHNYNFYILNKGLALCYYQVLCGFYRV